MSLLLAGAVGCVLGAAYIAHLWYAVRRFVLAARHSPRTGTLLRVSGITVAFLIIGRTGSSNLIAALIGLLTTRTVLIWRVGRTSGA